MNKLTFQELIHLNKTYSDRLLKIELNAAWPGDPPEWLAEFGTLEEATVIFKNHLASSWTLDDIDYSGELLIVKFTDEYLSKVAQHYETNKIPEEERNAIYKTEKNFLVLGEIAQKPGRFILYDPETNSILRSGLEGFQAREIQILIKE